MFTELRELLRNGAIVSITGDKIPFDLNIIFMLLWLSSESAHMKQPSTVTSPGVICEEADNTKAWQRRMINIRLP